MWLTRLSLKNMRRVSLAHGCERVIVKQYNNVFHAKFWGQSSTSSAIMYLQWCIIWQDLSYEMMEVARHHALASFNQAWFSHMWNKDTFDAIPCALRLYEIPMQCIQGTVQICDVELFLRYSGGLDVFSFHLQTLLNQWSPNVIL